MNRHGRTHLRWLPAVLPWLCLWAAAFAQSEPVPTGPAPDEFAIRTEQTAALLDKARARRNELMKADADLYALGLLEVEKARLLHSNLWWGTGQSASAVSALDRADKLLQHLLDGTDPKLPRHGRIECAYLAPDDGSAQPYTLYVPEGYDGSRPFGLLVYLHGYAPDLDKENWVSAMYADVLDDYARQCDMIMAMPFGRSNTDFQGIGEDDVMYVTDKVIGRYNIDPDRVVLSGYSMGGMGAWTIAAHYPHRFAAVLCISSRADFYMWKKMRPEDLQPFKRKLITQEFGAELLRNYRHLPAFLVHGSDDWGIDVEQSRKMYERLKAGGFDARYLELPGLGHLFFYREEAARPELVEWLRTRRRGPAPRRITWRATSLKYGTAYWAEVLAIEDWGRPADATCELSEDGKSLTVTTDNVLRLRVRPPRALGADVRALRIVWNGREATGRPDGADAVCLGAEPPGGALQKTAALCGPVREAFAGPFVMVYGGPDGGAGHKKALLAARDWMRFAKGIPTLLPAQEVTDETAAANNLILFGTPQDNPWIARIAPQLPIAFENGAYRVGERTYDAAKYGLWLIYPNPLAPGRCVAVNSGPPWGRLVAENHKYDFIPDFMVYADEKSKDGTECNKVVCAGFFDQYWRLSGQSTWHNDEPR